MQAIYRALSRYADAMLWLGGVAMILMMLHVTFDVAGKHLFGTPIVGTLESVTHYYMVAVIFLPVVAVQRARGQIIVDIATQHLAPRRLALLEAALSLGTLIFLALLVWYSMRRAIDMTEIREKTNALHFPIDIWPSRWFVVLGGIGIAGFVVLQSINDFSFALTGRRLFTEDASSAGHG